MVCALATVFVVGPALDLRAAEAPEAAEEGTPAAGAADGTGSKDALSLFSADGIDLLANLQAAAALLSVRNAGLGAGTRSRRNGSILHDPSWADGFVKPGLTVSVDRDDGSPGITYGGMSGISAWTLGDGDAYGPPGGIQATRGKTSHTDVEALYGGWRSAPQAGRSADGVDISFGRQEFSIGDGFLIGDGHYDKAKDGGYYSAGRLAWSNSAIARIAWSALRGDLFWLKGDKNSGSSAIGGVNGAWLAGDRGTLGAAWMRVLNDNAAESGYPARNGMLVQDLRAQGHFLPGLEELFVSAEWGREANDAGVPRHQRAEAGYGEIGYAWRSLPWTPNLAFRLAHFSGDKPGTAADEGWDPLRYGAIRGWGTWFMGEIAGEYMLFNSNENVRMLHAKVQPTDAVTVGGIGYIFAYDQPGSVARTSGATGVSSRDFGREVDLYMDWAASDWLSISTAVGLFVPGQGAKEAYGSGKDVGVVETLISLRF